MRAGGPSRPLFYTFLLTALLCIAFGLACAGPVGENRPNVLIVTFDTTRADHIGAYGHLGARTPTVDALAEQGVLFEWAYAPVPITLPSHSSLMTGKLPLAHGVRDNGLFVLGDEQRTLAEVLRDEGYRTAAAIGSFPLTSQFGIDQGFELYDDHVTADFEDFFGARIFPKQDFFFDERPAGRVNDAVLPWLEENADEPFFLWIHYFDPHHPHEPPPPYDELFAHELYDGEIAYSDESLGALLNHLERLGVRDRTAVVFTSDHGEGRGEHGESTHSMLAYNSTLRVPLIFSMPGAATARRVSERVSTIDVLPTVLEWLGLGKTMPEDVQGESLARYLDADLAVEEVEAPSRSRRRLYAETLSPRLSRQWGELRALYYGDFKYIHGPRPELYDLSTDPDELRDLIGDRDDVARDMKRRLEGFVADNAVTDLDASTALDDESLRKLQALGYMQSSGEKVGPIEERLREDGDPPQDHAATTTMYSQAKAHLFHGRIVEAQDFLVDLLRTDPGNVHYLELMLNVEIQSGRLNRALELIDELKQASQESGYPPLEKLLQRSAAIHVQRGELDEAYAATREAMAVAPEPAGFYRLAKIHQQRREAADQKRWLERALEEDPNFLPARLDLAVVLAVEGQTEQAEAAFLEALQRQPYFARAHYNYGTFLAQSDRAEEAVARFQRALEIEPRYLLAHAALVEIYVASGLLEEAEHHLEQLERAAPDAAETGRAREAFEQALRAFL